MADGTGSPFQLRVTYERFLRVLPQDHILVVTLSRFGDEARKVIPELAPENLLLEPFPRGTAPCMALAAYTLRLRDPEAVIIATPWDSVIRDEDLFARTVLEACDYVEEHDVLMTLGVVPRGPEVNFGYIQVKEGRNAHNMPGPLQVKTFTEKPSRELAQVFFRTGEFFWNSGVFIWKADTICKEMERYIPEVTEQFRGWEEHVGEPVFLEQAYAGCPRVSLDYGVMERTDRAWLYPGHFGWADVERI
jgi:mannose-1-phosphate guanylyltransferase